MLPRPLRRARSREGALDPSPDHCLWTRLQRADAPDTLVQLRPFLFRSHELLEDGPGRGCLRGVQERGAQQAWPLAAERLRPEAHQVQAGQSSPGERDVPPGVASEGFLDMPALLVIGLGDQLRIARVQDGREVLLALASALPHEDNKLVFLFLLLGHDALHVFRLVSTRPSSGPARCGLLHAFAEPPG